MWWQDPAVWSGWQLRRYLSAATASVAVAVGGNEWKSSQTLTFEDPVFIDRRSHWTGIHHWI